MNRILIIDNDSDLAESLREITRFSMNLPIDTANTAGEVLNLLSKYEYKLIVVDYFFAYHQSLIRQINELKTNVIVMSSWGKPQEAFNSRARILLKPFNIDEFIEMCHTLITAKVFHKASE